MAVDYGSWWAEKIAIFGKELLKRLCEDCKKCQVKRCGNIEWIDKVIWQMKNNSRGE